MPFALMPDIKFSDVVDVEKIKQLFYHFSDVTGIKIFVYDLETKKELLNVSECNICSNFYHKESQACSLCVDITQNSFCKKDHIETKICENGLTAGTIPIIIEEKNLALLGIGQVFVNSPDIAYHKKQAEKLGFNVDEYIKTIKQVPIIDGKKFKNYLKFLYQMATTITEIGISNLNTQKAKNDLQKMRDDLEKHVAERTQHLQNEIIQKKLVEIELIGARKQAENASKTKAEFLANMSHELRTPMTGIIGMADLLLDSELSDIQQKQVNILRSSAETLVTVLNDILDFSKIEAGKMELEEIDFSISETIKNTIKLLDMQAAEKNLQLICKLPENAPEYVKGDTTKIQQILFNLIGNAIKFTDKGTINIELAECFVKKDKDEVFLRFNIKDTGIGIKPEDKTRLFEAFAQGDVSTTRKFGGTGLGLAICSRLVQQMGGMIGVESTYGEGSTFWFTVVLRTGNSGTKTTEQPLSKTDDERQISVLLAEDNETIQMVVSMKLENQGHKVTVVENGLLALEMIRNNPTDFDIVFMDAQMPKMDGPTATREIRKLSGIASKTPIIALTADVVEEHRDSYMKAGFDKFLTKPIDWNDMYKTISELTSR